MTLQQKIAIAANSILPSGKPVLNIVQIRPNYGKTSDDSLEVIAKNALWEKEQREHYMLTDKGVLMRGNKDGLLQAEFVLDLTRDLTTETINEYRTGFEEGLAFRFMPEKIISRVIGDQPKSVYLNVPGTDLREEDKFTISTHPTRGLYLGKREMLSTNNVTLSGWVPDLVVEEPVYDYKEFLKRGGSISDYLDIPEGEVYVMRLSKEGKRDLVRKYNERALQDALEAGRANRTELYELKSFATRRQILSGK